VGNAEVLFIEGGSGLLCKIPLNVLWSPYVGQDLKFRNVMFYSRYTFIACVLISEQTAIVFPMRHQLTVRLTENGRCFVLG
jgi:hypothetical protein